MQIGKVLLGMLFYSVASSAPAFIVDKDEYMLHVVEDGAILFSQRVVIGRKSRPTPDMEDMITHVVINPTWTVPSKLARLDVVPKIQKNPAVIKSLGYHFYTSHDKTQEIDPSTIDWSQFNRKTPIPFTIVQQPGHHNALGSVKFMMTNNRSIYMHGTPHTELFDLPEREKSSGCIRVEDPVALAEYLLPDVDIRGMLRKYKGEHWIRLAEPVPVSITSQGVVADVSVSNMQ